jgi:hypothetical protein
VQLQDIGLDTIEANHALGFGADYRDYRLPIAILRDLGIDRVRLLSNNPDKLRALAEADIEVVALIPCEVAPNLHSAAYLRAKKEKMGHALSLGQRDRSEDDERAGDRFECADVESAVRELRAGRWSSSSTMKTERTKAM